jgi:uncharacterized membrane protein (DUF4010 family)
MSGIDWTIQLRFVVAVALGFLIGLERQSSSMERETRVFSGLRTFSLISILGFACAVMYERGVPTLLPLGLFSIAVFAAMEYYAKQLDGRVGWTTEVAAVLTFVIGALCVIEDVWLPMAIAIVTAILLSEKAELEEQVEKLQKVELLAILRFLLVSLIIYPVLPDQKYTRFEIIPTDVWKIVIMVSGVGFFGYFLGRRYGSRAGLWLSGLLGGIVSSTFVTVAMGRIAQKDAGSAREALRASLIASSVMYVRILALVSVVNSAFFDALAWKMAVLTAAGAVICLSVRTEKRDMTDRPATTLQNPFEIKPALLFAALFVALSVITKLVREKFGSMGFLALAAVVGVTDIDPFLLSVAHDNADITPDIVRGMLLAMMSNTLIKGIYFSALAESLRIAAMVRYAIWTLLHVPLLFL